MKLINSKKYYIFSFSEFYYEKLIWLILKIIIIIRKIVKWKNKRKKRMMNQGGAGPLGGVIGNFKPIKL